MVLGEFGGAFLEPVPMNILQRAGDLLMESNPSRRDNLCDNLVVQCLPKARVAEAVRNRGPDNGAIFDDPSRGRLFERRHQLPFRASEH
jgi:hypothetical protein